MDGNTGIAITGGNVSAGAMAAGPGATATNVAPGTLDGSLSDLRAEMVRLIEVLYTEAKGLTDADQTIAVAKLAERELAKEQPNKGSVLSLLQVLASGVGSVASLAGAVATIQQAVAAVL
jgi:hypothetical protein